MPKLIADGREFEISAEVWRAWQRQANPFELPDDVLRRCFGIEESALAGVNGSPSKASSADTPARPRKASKRSAQSARPKGKRTRVPSNLLLPESEYERPILEALAAVDGRRPTREVLNEVGRRLADRLTDLDKEAMHENGPPRWQNRAQFVRLRLVKEGLMEKDSPRGVWEISAQGEKRLREGTK
jgi:Mrr N-terminal domain